MSEDLLVLREILQRELETINAYERMLTRVGDPSLRQIIEHVTDEEREHVSEMYALIMARDPQLRLRSERSHAQLTAMALIGDGASPPPHGEDAASVANTPLTTSQKGDTGASPPSIAPLPLQGETWPDGAWSVGPLKGRSS